MHPAVPLSGFRHALHLHQVGIAAAQLLQLLRQITLASRLSLHSTQQEIRQHSTGASSCTYSHFTRARLFAGKVGNGYSEPVNAPSQCAQSVPAPLPTWTARLLRPPRYSARGRSIPGSCRREAS